MFKRFKFFLDEQLALKEDHRYMNQVQMQMYIYELFCAFSYLANFFSFLRSSEIRMSRVT